jgi:serine/threonine protein kinase
MAPKCLRDYLDQNKMGEFAQAVWEYARPERLDELGALKVFKIRSGGAPAEARLKTEITVLGQKRPNLPKLLDANENERWMVTEFFPNKTLFDHPLMFKGQVAPALRAFRTLVQTVANSLHNDGIVHRDIKPANIFIAQDGSLVPGDFGIVYLPEQPGRPTILGERVGPWEYMPPWADGLGEELEKVEPNFDVYMLGKLLWCMVSGRLRLRREDFKDPQYDLTKAFPDNNDVHVINSILEKCLVTRPEACLSSAADLLQAVDTAITQIEQHVPVKDQDGNLILPCIVCGKGFYREYTKNQFARLQMLDEYSRPVSEIRLRPFVCNVCTHEAFFAPNYPEEAVGRKWARWKLD